MNPLAIFFFVLAGLNLVGYIGGLEPRKSDVVALVITQLALGYTLL